MAEAQNIAIPRAEPRLSVSASMSPTAAFHSPSAAVVGEPKQLKPFNTQDIKILLLENVNESGRDILTRQGYQVEALKTSLPEDQLIEKIRYVGPSSAPGPHGTLFPPPDAVAPLFPHGSTVVCFSHLPAFCWNCPY